MARQRRDTVVIGGSPDRRLRWLSVAAGIWALWYAIYRAYYAAGGTGFLPGTIRPGAEVQFQLINLFAAVVIGVAAILPLATLPLWSRPWARRMLVVLCWAVAVGCCMHALVNITGRVLSLAGMVSIDYPSSVWATVDHRTADLQDLFFNEPWFLVEGLAFGALGWFALGPGRPRRWWTGSAAVAIAALLLLGILTMTATIGKTVVF